MTAPAFLEAMLTHTVTIYEEAELSGERGALTGGTATLGTGVAALVAPLTPKDRAEMEPVGELRQATARLYVAPDQDVENGSVIEIESGPGWAVGSRFSVVGRPQVFPVPFTGEDWHKMAYLREEV